jgi:polysaccharide export outer membrane protein
MGAPNPRGTRSQALLSALSLLFLAGSGFALQSHAQVVSLASGQTGSQSSVQQRPALQSGGRAEGVAPQGIGNLVLKPGSLVSIQVFEEPDLNGEYRMDDQGNITMPLIGSVPLNGLKLAQAEQAISTKLVAGEILKTAQVTANVTEYSASQIVVLGEVRSPGAVPILSPQPLLEVLASAGGETELAGNEIQIHRAGSPPDSIENVTYQRDSDQKTARTILINPGDTVTVTRTGIVYVLGAVVRPGGYAMQDNGAMNVTQALAMAMGLAPAAATRSVRVLRRYPDGKVGVFAVSYKEINRGRQEPLDLQADDVVYVSSSTTKNILINSRSVFSSSASAAIYVYH